SGAKATGLPRTEQTAGTMCDSELTPSGPCFGRPKCDMRIALPPASVTRVMVGRAASIRVVSVTSPSLTGTLKSTRMRTRLLVRPKSSRVRKSLIIRLRGEAFEQRVVTDDEAVFIHRNVSRERSVCRLVAVESREVQTAVAL